MKKFIPLLLLALAVPFLLGADIQNPGPCPAFGTTAGSCAQGNDSRFISTPVSVANGGTGDTGTAWTAYTPTLSCGTGTLTTASATGRYKTLGKTVFVEVSANISVAGTCAGSLRASTPVTAAANNYILSALDIGTATALSALIGSADGTTIRIFTITGTFPTGFGGPTVTGVYESS